MSTYRFVRTAGSPARPLACMPACPTRVTRCTAAVSPRARADTIAAAAAAAALCDHFTLTVTCSRPRAAALDACSLLLTMRLAACAVQAESVEYSQTPLGPDYEYPLQWRVHVGPGGAAPSNRGEAPKFNLAVLLTLCGQLIAIDDENSFCNAPKGLPGWLRLLTKIRHDGSRLSEFYRK